MPRTLGRSQFLFERAVVIFSITSRSLKSASNASRTRLSFFSSIDAISLAPWSRRSTYLVDPVRVEGDVILDLRHRFKWILISPHRIARTIAAGGNVVVGSVALVGTVRCVFAAREPGHIDIPTRDVLNGRIGGFAQRQRMARVGDDLSAS